MSSEAATRRGARAERRANARHAPRAVQGVAVSRDAFMKGPRSRHKFNALRVWECPLCQKRVFEPARVSHRVCVCRGKDEPTWMRLIEPPPRRRVSSPDPVPEVPPPDQASSSA